MTHIDRLNQRAETLLLSGRRQEARELLQALLRQQPNNQRAWELYMTSAVSLEERIQATEAFLAVHCDDIDAQHGLHELQQEQRRQLKTACASAHEKNVMQAQAFQRKTRRWWGWLLAVSLCLLVVLCAVGSLAWRVYTDLTVQLTSLQEQYDSLDTSFQVVELVNESLRNEYASLKNTYNQQVSENNLLVERFNLLVGEYDGLMKIYNELVLKYDDLVGSFNSLVGERDALASQYDTLTSDFDELERTALKPPYISMYDRIITVAFFDLNGSLVEWITPFENLESYIVEGNQLRDAIINQGRYTYTIYTSDGRAIGARDYTVFLQPQVFKNVIPSLYADSRSDEEFIQRTWNIVRQLSDYTEEENAEIPRFPSETMFAGGGDCEDLSILFASMIQAAPVNWQVELVYVDTNNLYDPQYTNHVIVYINTGNQQYLVETTEKNKMQPYENGVSGWLVSQVGSYDESERYPVSLP
jgi:cell division protein FtsB